MRRIAAYGWLLALVAGGAAWAQEQPGVTTSYESKKPAATDAKMRPDWQRPDQVLGLLSVGHGEHVVYLGPRTGKLQNMLAAQVGRRETFYVLEVERTADANLGLPEGQVDLVLALNTWHQIKDRRAMREKLRRALKPGGRLAIIDWHGGDIPAAPPLEDRVPHDKLVADMKAAGWTVTTDTRMLEYQYFVILTPPVR